MSWQDDSVALIREQIGDTNCDNYTYPDERLQEVFIISAYNTIQDVGFNTTYSVTISSSTISPDPSTDRFFMSLTALKAACIILFSEYKTAGNAAVKVVDGPSTIDYTAVAKNLKDMFDHCTEQYERVKFKYNIGEGASGEVVLTPYSPGGSLINYRGHQR